MPRLVPKKFVYTKGDEVAIARAVGVLVAIKDYDDDEQAIRDATSGIVALNALGKHVATKRNGKPEAK